MTCLGNGAHFQSPIPDRLASWELGVLVMPTPSLTLEAVSAARWRIAISLTIAMMVAYFGFILLVAFNKPLLGTRAGARASASACCSARS